MRPSRDATFKLMQRGGSLAGMGKVTSAVVAKFLTLEVGVKRARPCPVCLGERVSVTNAEMPIVFYDEDDGSSRWRCEREGCQAGAGAGPLSLAVAWVYGEILLENDPRVAKVRDFIRSLRRPAGGAA